uniref:Secreted protein n=1 Tax=Taenia asiatica TaxID=60517 RepID=A0A0R3WGL4_TAEAS
LERMLIPTKVVQQMVDLGRWMNSVTLLLALLAILLLLPTPWTSSAFTSVLSAWTLHHLRICSVNVVASSVSVAAPNSPLAPLAADISVGWVIPSVWKTSLLPPYKDS